LPNEQYKLIWQHIDKTIPGKPACKLIVGLLQLASEAHCELALAEVVLNLIQNDKQIKLVELQKRFSLKSIETPMVVVNQHAINGYDNLIIKDFYNVNQEACYA
jgi:hypothetical protein